MNDERNLLPSVVQTLYELQGDLRKKGLNERDMIILLQDRIRIKERGCTKKMKRAHIKAVLDGLKKLEREILNNIDKRKPKEERDRA